MHCIYSQCSLLQVWRVNGMCFRLPMRVFVLRPFLSRCHGKKSLSLTKVPLQMYALFLKRTPGNVEFITFTCQSLLLIQYCGCDLLSKQFQNIKLLEYNVVIWHLFTFMLLESQVKKLPHASVNTSLRYACCYEQLCVGTSHVRIYFTVCPRMCLYNYATARACTHTCVYVCKNTHTYTVC